MRPLFPLEFSGVCRIGVVESLAVDVLSMLGQMTSNTRRQIGIDAIRHM